MKLLHWLLNGFLAPGDFALRLAGINLDEDGGILRSLINMCFWGAIALIVVLNYF